MTEFRHGTREERAVRPVQLLAARLPPLHDSELVSQDQDLRSLPRLVTPGQLKPCGDSRDQEKHEPQAHDGWSSRPGGRESKPAGQSHGRDSRHAQDIDGMDGDVRRESRSSGLLSPDARLEWRG